MLTICQFPWFDKSANIYKSCNKIYVGILIYLSLLIGAFGKQLWLFFRQCSSWLFSQRKKLKFFFYVYRLQNAIRRLETVHFFMCANVCLVVRPRLWLHLLMYKIQVVHL